jgi:DNA-directed RNA polymerase subunit delta
MAKKRAIISYEKLTLEQKRNLEHSFPEGFSGSLTTIKLPSGEEMDAVIWETEEITYLVKITKAAYHSALDDDDDDLFDSSIADEIKVEDDDDVSDDDEDDDYDDSDDDDDDDDDEDED